MKRGKRVLDPRCCHNPHALDTLLGPVGQRDQRAPKAQLGRFPQPLLTAMRQLPGTAAACCDRNSADGLATPFKPRSVIANTPSSLAAPNRFLIARTRRKLECVSPSK